MTHNLYIINEPIAPNRNLEEILSKKLGYNAITCDAGQQASEPGLLKRSLDLAILDQPRSQAQLLNMIKQVKLLQPHLPMLVLIRYDEDDLAASAIAAGVQDFLVMPIGVERLKLTIRNIIKMQLMRNTITYLERRNCGKVTFEDIIGNNDIIRMARSVARMAATSKTSSEFPVWIDGEQGTGKELMARAIHGSGPRAGKPFVTVECEHIGTDMCGDNSFSAPVQIDYNVCLMEKIKEAGDGTIYFREISKLPREMQLCLLDLLMVGNMAVRRQQSSPFTVRIICGNSKNIGYELHNASFSSELYTHLKVIKIPLPSLRERMDDIAALARHFLSTYATLENISPLSISSDALKALEDHPWPGNIRQLSNMLWRAALLCRGSQVDAGTLRLIQQMEPALYAPSDGTLLEASTFFDMQGQLKKMKSIEEDAIRLAISHSGGSMTKAARKLGIGRSTLYRKLEEMELGPYMRRASQTTRPMMRVSSNKFS